MGKTRVELAMSSSEVADSFEGQGFIADSCLLCAHSPAVIYDVQGLPIKREKQTDAYSYQELFSNFCHLLGFRKNSRFLKEWNFNENSHPFPFCDRCEGLMVSLSELYTKLSHLETEVREEMRRAERHYADEELYGKHSEKYLDFRKYVLGVDFMGHKRVPRGDRDRKVAPSRIFQCDSYQPPPNPRNKRVLRKRKTSPFLSKKISGTIKKEKRITEVTNKLDFLHEDEHMIIGGHPPSPPPLKDQYLEPSKDLSDVPPSPMEESGDSLFEPNKSNRTYSRRGRPKAKHVHQDLPNKKLVHHLPDLAEAKTDHKTKSSRESDNMWRAVHSRGPMSLHYKKRSRRSRNNIKVDASTGSVLYSSSHGSNRFKTTKITLTFRQLEGDEGGYKCALCLHNLSPTAKSKGTITGTTKPHWGILFYSHLVAYHTDRYKCKLCPADSSESVHFRTKTDLATHLSQVHRGKTISKMIGIVKQRYFSARRRGKDLKPTSTSTSSTTNIHDSLEPDAATQIIPAVIETTQLIHPNPKFPTQCVSTQPETLCPDCGELVKGGRTAWDSHRFRKHKEKPTIIHQKAVCQICGLELCNKYALEGHVQRLHPPNGKWKGPTDCRYPSCDQEAFGNAEDLQKHIENEHGNSESALKGLLCKVCGMTCNGSSWNLKNHMKVHTGQRNHSCHLCPKAFPEKATLNLHLAAIHQTGVYYGIFLCEVEGCGEKFPCDSYLRLHQRRKHGMLRGGRGGSGKRVKTK